MLHFIRLTNVANFTPEWHLKYLKYPWRAYFLMQLRNVVLCIHLYSFMCVWYNIIKHFFNIYLAWMQKSYILKKPEQSCALKPSPRVARGRIWTIQQLKVCITPRFAHFNPVLSGGGIQGHLLVCPSLCGPAQAAGMCSSGHVGFLVHSQQLCWAQDPSRDPKISGYTNPMGQLLT